ncbi:Mu-like prophage major head subunit gpT family protein (plasmid) [Tistrella mobilis]|uniref:Mu-like prophage major head subunit gpT family protein n=1 Tax=Tistrella mobilis TaxID=171437 RepID=UPI0035569BA2
MIINGETIAKVSRGFRAIYNEGAAAYTPEWPTVAMEVTSTTAAEEYAWLGNWPRMREWLGDRVLTQLKAHGFTIRNRDFEATVTVPRNAIEDDRIGLFSPMMRELGTSAAQHPDELVFDLLAAGWTRSCYDGQPFFDEDHPVIVDGTEISVSNVLRGSAGNTGPAWYLVAAGGAMRPIIYQRRRPYQFVAKADSQSSDHVFMRAEYVYGVDGRGSAGFGLWQLCFGSNAPLTRENFEALYARMRAQKGDNGRALNIRPTHLIVPPALRGTAATLIKAETIDGTTNTNRDVVQVVDSAWLS